MMPTAAILTLSFATSLPPALSDANALARAEQAFAEGTTLRADADAARPHFLAAAREYDALWRSGHHAPALALNRARAHRLAGDLPGCLAALQDGLTVTPYNRALQVERENARAAVAYPLVGELAAECRPKPPGGISSRMSPAEAYLVVGGLWLFACLGIARYVLTRIPMALAAAGAALAGLVILGGVWWRDEQHRAHEATHPLVIVTADTLLRRGNGESYPPRLEPKLPRGVEARERNRRGGWVQVELAGGAIGWLPESAVIAATAAVQ